VEYQASLELMDSLAELDSEDLLVVQERWVIPDRPETLDSPDREDSQVSSFTCTCTLLPSRV